MKLGDFRAKTAHLPDNVDMVHAVYMDTYRTISGIFVVDTLMQIDCDNSRIFSDLGCCMPEDEKFPTIIIGTLR